MGSRIAFSLAPILVLAGCIGDQPRLARDTEVALSDELTLTLPADAIAYGDCTRVCPRAGAAIERIRADGDQGEFSLACAQLPNTEATVKVVLTSLNERGWTEYSGSLHYPTYYKLDSCSHLMLFPLLKEDLCNAHAEVEQHPLLAGELMLAFHVDRLDPCTKPQDMLPFDPQPAEPTR